MYQATARFYLETCVTSIWSPKGMAPVGATIFLGLQLPQSRLTDCVSSWAGISPCQGESSQFKECRSYRTMRAVPTFFSKKVGKEGVEFEAH